MSRPPVLASFYLYQAAASCVFFAPVFYVYYGERVGLSLATILWVQSYYLAVRALLDVPLGALADRSSRAACLAAYAAGLAIGSAALLAWPTLPCVVLAETVFAVGGAFRSGADSAFLFDALAASGRLDLYPRAESRAQAVIAVTTGATAIAGGLLAAADLRLPYVATIVAAATSGIVAVRFAVRETGRGRGTSVRLLIRDAARTAAASAAVRWVIALSAFTVVASHVYYYLQQPYLRAIGMPLAAFGVVFAATKGVTALVASTAHRLDATLGPRRTTALMTAAPVFGLGAMAAVGTPAGALLVLTRGLLDGLWQPLLNVYMNRLVESRVRATMLSAQSLAARLVLAAVIALAGGGTATVGLFATLAIAAGIAVVVGTLLVVTAPRGARASTLAATPACDS